MKSHPPQRHYFWLLICLGFISLAPADARAITAKVETTQFMRAKPCGQVIQYKIGKIDSQFGVDSQRVMAAAEQAAALWNAAANAKLLEYNAAGSVTVELVYDARQNLMQRYDDYAATIKQEEARAERMKADAAGMQSQMDAASAALNAEQKDFEIKLDAYNARVDRLNDIGGGTRGQVRQLDQIKHQLDLQKSDLEERSGDLNKLNVRRQELVDEHNAVVDHVKEMAASANREFGKDIVAGLYTKSGNRATIEIFAFVDRANLMALLAHEFGHALGLGHSKELDSIMGKLRKNDGLVDSPPPLANLNPVDVKALANICEAPPH